MKFQLWKAIRALALIAVFPAAAWAQQAATITGRVTGPGGEGIAAANVRIPAMNIGVTTRPDGTYTLPIPGARAQAGQQVQLTAQRVGLGTQTRTVTLTPGGTVTQNFQLTAEALGLEELVVTGTSGGAVQRQMVPFTVARVDAEQMPVQGVNPLSQIQGRVPGANIAAATGRPGVAPQVILRGPTSLNASGRSQEPLYIVDGVVLGSSIADINPADIESVEIVKGAAAATLYGSRAASGVISIRTRRGTTEGVRFTARSEIGFNDIEREHQIARYRPLLMDETGTRFCVSDGIGSANACTRTVDWQAEMARINSAPGVFAQTPVGFSFDPQSPAAQLQRVFMAGQWPGRQINAVQQLVEPKPLMLNDFSMSGRTGSTNFFASVGHSRQGGAVQGLEGYERLNGRVNLGHRIGDQWAFDVNTYLSRSEVDGANQEEFNGGFFQLTRMPGISDLTQRDPQGRLFVRTNLLLSGTQNPNPLYTFENAERTDERHRYIVGGKVRYTPLEWLEADGEFNVDRLNTNYFEFSNRGYRTTNSQPATNEGLIFQGVDNVQSLNGSTGVLLRPQLASWTDNRVLLRWLYEQQDFDRRTLQGNRLRVADVRDARNATVLQAITGIEQQTKQMSVAAGLAGDILGRYTYDFAVRRDGNSRFGEDNRWQTYGRASAGWLVAREEWFPSDVMSAFTLRASYGTAGNAPSYAAQYETFSIGAGGALNALTAGNPNLRPEVVREVEVGMDLEVLRRYGLSVTYANSLAENQILPVPVAATTGFPTQWQNAGALRNKTWEAALTLPVIQARDFTWMSRANYTRNRSVIERLDVPPFFIGTAAQATENIFRIAEGERFGTFYGVEFMTRCDQLPTSHQNQCGTSTSAFQRNDEGYLVWVGEGNNPGMGITQNLWNAILPASEAPYGQQAAWGMPILIREADGTPSSRPLGSALPDYRVGFSNTLTYKGLSLYGLVEGVFGRSVWNQARHWAQLEFLAGELDQGDKSVAEAKPIGYYWRRGPGNAGSSGVGGFYDVLSNPSNRMVEDARFIKLREVSAGYNVGRVGGFGDWTVSVVGRNLKTWTDYTGFDPETGIQGRASEAGSGLINAVNVFTFPQLRTVSFVLSTTF